MKNWKGKERERKKAKEKKGRREGNQATISVGRNEDHS